MKNSARNFLILLLSLGAIFLLLFLMGFLYALHDMTITSSPTSITYEFKGSPKDINLLIMDAKLFALRSGFIGSGEDASTVELDKSSTHVTLYVRNDRRSGTVTILTKEKKSLDWQAQASSLESLIARRKLLVDAYVEKDPSIYKCNPSCIVTVYAPVDFAELNNSILTIPLLK